jgi:hypothetical protein
VFTDTVSKFSTELGHINGSHGVQSDSLDSSFGSISDHT